MNVTICEESTRKMVCYFDPAKPNEHYQTASASSTDADRVAAIQGHIAQRRTAGVSYVGQLPPPQKTLTI